MKRILPFILLPLLFGSCGSSKPSAVLEPEPGCIITISSVSVNRAKQRVTGVVVIENNAASFVKLSDRELFMHCGNDSARTFIALKGDWQIDDGLINVMKGKKLTYQVYWPLVPAQPSDSITFRYIKFLERSPRRLQNDISF